MMAEDAKEQDEHIPGFVTVWKAEDAGEPQEITCPRCDKVFGTVGEKTTTELLCRQCQTMYRVVGNPDGEPTVEQMGRKIIVAEGDGRLGDALRGKRPTEWKFTTGDYVFQIMLVILLFVALMISMSQ